jgi:hypothetical protein
MVTGVVALRNRDVDFWKNGCAAELARDLANAHELEIPVVAGEGR